MLPIAKHRWVLAALLAVTALIRSTAIDRPLLGNFATKNVVYAMIARNWARGQAPLWQPTLDVLRGGKPSLHLTELPVAIYLPALGWKCLGGSLDAWGRGTSVLFSVVSVGAMWMLVRRWHGAPAAWGAAWLLALSPVSVIYGQSFMLEASVVCWTLVALVALERWLDGSRPGWLAAAGLALSLLWLTKVYMLVLLLPIAALAWRARLPRLRYVALLATTFTAALPAIAWCEYVRRVGQEGHPDHHRIYYSLFDSAASHAIPHPLLRDPGFYRQLLDDLVGPMLTPLGFALALLGLFHPHWRRHLPWLAAMLLLVVGMPRKFYEMNYYDLIALPPLAVLGGLGWATLIERCPMRRWSATVAIGFGLLFCARYAYRPAFVTPSEDGDVVFAGQTLHALTRPEDHVFAAHGSGIDLLYYCDRTGFAATGIDWADIVEPDRLGSQGNTIAAVVDTEQFPRFAELVADDPRFAKITQCGRFALYRCTSLESQAACSCSGTDVAREPTANGSDPIAKHFETQLRPSDLAAPAPQKRQQPQSLQKQDDGRRP